MPREDLNDLIAFVTVARKGASPMRLPSSAYRNLR
jgi:hypothetical protein